jgi:serpin B
LIAPNVIDTQTRLVLANAIYFKARWEIPFDANESRERPFNTGTAAGTVRVNMMERTGQLAYARGHGAQVVELPYRGDLSMVVMIPDAVDGLAAVERAAGDSYDGWIAALQPERVELQLPHWTTTSSLSLADTLKAMGMPLPFDASAADFWGMAEPADIRKFPGTDVLYIGAVLQKAFIDTNEQGTEAAAVTAVVMEQAISLIITPRPKPIIVHADHPFLYVIRDRKTGAILFMGRVTSPPPAVSLPHG